MTSVTRATLSWSAPLGGRRRSGFVACLSVSLFALRRRSPDNGSQTHHKHQSAAVKSQRWWYAAVIKTRGWSFHWSLTLMGSCQSGECFLVTTQLCHWLSLAGLLLCFSRLWCSCCSRVANGWQWLWSVKPSRILLVQVSRGLSSLFYSSVAYSFIHKIDLKWRSDFFSVYYGFKIWIKPLLFPHQKFWIPLD